MLAYDDIREGMWIAVIHAEDATQYDGVPYKVEAVNLPFVALTNVKGKLYTLDARRHSITRLSRKYVSKYRELLDQAAEEIPSKDKMEMGRDDPEGSCPHCGETLMEKWRGNSVWVEACGACGFTADEPLDL